VTQYFITLSESMFDLLIETSFDQIDCDFNIFQNRKFIFFNTNRVNLSITILYILKKKNIQGW
jgi:hypothetical protein